MTFSVDKVRADFPVLSREVNGLPLAYLDSAASAQKPSQVIDAEAEFYRHGYAAVHRGIHTLSAQATEKMENVRKRASLFINARSAEELVFVRGTTEGINLVANSWGNSNVRAGDNIIISQMEHHANIVPWQMLCARVGAELRVIPLNPDGTLQLETLPTLFDEKTRRCIIRWMFRRWIAIFTCSPGINCMALPELAFFMSKKPCCRRCRRGKGAVL